MRRFDKELDKIRDAYFQLPNYIMMFDDGDLFDLLNETEITYEVFLKIKAKYKELKELAKKQVLIDEIMEEVDDVLKDIKTNYYQEYLQNKDINDLKSVKSCFLMTLWSEITMLQLAKYNDKISKEHERVIRKAEKQNEKNY